MKNFIIGLLIILSINQILFSQIKRNFSFNISHPIKFGGENLYNPQSFKIFPDTFKVIAIMVQFQEDNDPNSTGNGKFDLSNKYYDPATQRDTVIDSPPHDSAYFTDHLEFLKNYYYKCSNGKVIIDYKLYGNVITLPKQMKDYSPLKNENFFKLGELYKDSWTRADSIINFTGIDTLKTGFIIFHAGVGRDVDLTSIFGYDPTPYDIPTVFLGIKNLKEIYGQNYNGYQTNEGVSIKNSLIIPSNELRELNLISGTTLLELGMNGILTASFGSFLGLPDLFNTQTGKTAIGRFGLMDGQSLFSYNGIFPPEPSAWEKIYLGWISPIVISSGDSYYKIKTSSSRNNYDSTVFKVLINSSEYFLIENRNRNPEYSGQIIYTRNRTFNDSVTYTKDIPGFISYDISKIQGNLTNVKYFDWSLPGQIDDTSNYRGGILIWHIDENIINANIFNNTINNNINHKGVDLEEAKGSQDIGVTISTPFGDVTGDGTFVDYWYNGYHYVPASIYKNAFTPISFPNSLSYSLANNNINITEFDTISSIMKFRVTIGGDIVKPLAGFPKNLGTYSPNGFTPNLQAIAFDLNGDGRDEFFANNGTDLFGFKSDGTTISNNPSGLLLHNYGSTPPGFAYSNSLGGRKLVVSNRYSSLQLNTGLFGFDNNLNLTDSTVDNFSNITTYSAPVIFDSNKVVWGFSNGWIYEKKLNGQPSGLVDTTNPGSVFQFSKVNQNNYLVSHENTKFITTGNLKNNLSVDSLITISLNKFFLNGNFINLNYSINQISLYPVLADVNKDGIQEIVFLADNKLYAINSNGVILENFPLNLNKELKSGITIADLNSDGIYEIIFVTNDGDLCAYGTNGKMLNGFPVKTGINTTSTPALANLNDTLGIIVLSGDGYLYGFKTSYKYDESRILWKNYQKDKYYSNNNFKSSYQPVSYSEKLPADKCYNWPNPVYDNKTFIRYFINGSAGNVIIKILDLAGELVTRFPGTAYSNADNEVIWNISNVQSGVYYGVIEAEVDGNVETRIIKIAVVK